MTVPERIFTVNGKPFFPLGGQEVILAGLHIVIGIIGVVVARCDEKPHAFGPVLVQDRNQSIDIDGLAIIRAISR